MSEERLATGQSVVRKHILSSILLRIPWQWG